VVIGNHNSHFLLRVASCVHSNLLDAEPDVGNRPGNTDASRIVV
jgi:hypothetical protein